MPDCLVAWELSPAINQRRPNRKSLTLSPGTLPDFGSELGPCQACDRLARAWRRLLRAPQTSGNAVSRLLPKGCHNTPGAWLRRSNAVFKGTARWAEAGNNVPARGADLNQCAFGSFIRQMTECNLMRMQDVPQRGKRGMIVASRNRFGQYLKQFVSPKQPGTAAQRGVWGNMTELSRVWNELSDERRKAWRRCALDVHSRPRFGQSGPLDGAQLFKKINSVLATCGREPLLDPPPMPVFGPNPVVGFVIRASKGGLALKLKVSAEFGADARLPFEDLMVFAWAPRNAGVDKNSHYAFLGLLSAPAKGESGITKLYLKKLKEWRRLKDKSYHLPLEGSRIFIRVWQQMNGWENETGMFQADALAPARTWPRGVEKNAKD